MNDEVLMQHGVVPKEWAWLNYGPSQYRKGENKIPDMRKKCLQLCDGDCFSAPPSSKRGEVWPENYVGGKEMTVGRGQTLTEYHI